MIHDSPHIVIGYMSDVNLYSCVVISNTPPKPLSERICCNVGGFCLFINIHDLYHNNLTNHKKCGIITD